MSKLVALVPMRHHSQRVPGIRNIVLCHSSGWTLERYELKAQGNRLYSSGYFDFAAKLNTV